MNKLRVILVGFLMFVAGQWLGPASSVLAAPDVALTVATVSAPDINCFFDNDCTIFVDDVAPAFAAESMTGSGFLQSRLWPRGQTGTTGVGLFPYLYRVDLRELVGSGNPGCVTAFSLDFGPVVPLDYDGDGELEQLFVITGGGLGTIAPSNVDLTGHTLTVSFSPAVCGDFSETQDNGESSFFIGLASPFRQREVMATIDNNWADPFAVAVRAPRYESGPSLTVVPSSGKAGDTVQVIGSGYTPGGYAGTLRWNGNDTGTISIPSGGAFSQPFIIPTEATLGDHEIAACSLNPCATGEFEQLATAPFAVTDINRPHQIFVPIVNKPAPAVAEPFSYVIDNAVSPPQDDLPGLDGTTPRPLTAIRDPRGTVSTFVANELVLQTNDDTVLNDLLNRTGGEVILTIDPADAGLTTVPKTYLIRANLNRADVSKLNDHINDLMDSDIQSAGQFAFADNDGPRILAMAAAEVKDGLTVGINWVSDLTGIPVDSNEAAAGVRLGGVTYTPDAYDWVHLAQGTTQDIGVPEAWTLMSRAGRLSNRVDLAILDGGFFPNGDFPADMTFISVVPFITDPRNVNGVDGSAPFHGTDVLQTAVARSDNNQGIVGVAAPVARPIAVFTSYDYVVSIAAVIAARGAGAEIINMSYSANVPAIVSWTVLPFDVTTAAIRASGTLLFASAGNDGKNVDGEDCILFVCWEHTWHTPCENSGVICVGGIGWNSQFKAGGSNFGPEEVDIYAPYTVYSGQSPAAPMGNTTVGGINGTSFSSPYAASVAALIWAANPSFSADQVWQTMRDTAHTSPDSRVNRYVNAFQAVLTAIGVGLDAELTAPTSGVTYDLGRSVRLAAQVGYVAVADGTPLRVEWRVDGNLIATQNYSPGAGSHILYPEAFARDLAVGSHTATVRVTAGSVVVERSVTFSIGNTPPTASLDEPANNATFCAGETVTFRGSGFDPNQFSGLPESAFAWRSTINGNLGTGTVLTVSTLSSGSHVITLRVTDDQGAWAEDSINLTILSATHPDCEDAAPTAAITTPAADSGSSNPDYVYDGFDNAKEMWYKDVTFSGTGIDEEDGTLTGASLVWTTDRTEVQPALLGTGNTISARLYSDSCFGKLHTVTLTVTDSGDNTRTVTRLISIWTLC